MRRFAVIGARHSALRRAGARLALRCRHARRRPRRSAADYPNRNITFIVGFAPGGGIDTFARVVAQELNEQAGFSIVIENRAGAASNIAAKAVAGATPDGYTLLFTGNSYAINQTFYRNPGYATEDLRPVAFVAIDSQALAVNAANPARSLPEFLEAGKTDAVQFRLRRLVGAHRRPNTSSTCWPRRTPPACRSRAARRHSMRCSASMWTSSRRRSPRCIRRSSRAPCGRSPSPARGAPRRCPTCRRSTSSACRASASTAGSASWRRPRRRPTSAPS